MPVHLLSYTTSRDFTVPVPTEISSMYLSKVGIFH